jgi:DNA polymerase (family 10)
MDKKDVARLLDQIAAFLELKGDNPFRIRAYQTAARAVSAYTGDLKRASDTGELAELKGVGPGTSEIIREVLATGSAQVLNQLRSEIPPGLVEMMGISGLGVAKIQQIHENLGIDSLAELEAAARDGRLARLPRFGPKTAQKILRSLAFLRRSIDYRLFHHARNESERFAKALSELSGVVNVTTAGSVRRRHELIRDLDFVVQTDKPGYELADRLGNLVGVHEFEGKAPGAFTLRFTSDTVADVYICSAATRGFELMWATGSQSHLNGLQARATTLGLEWASEGLRKGDEMIPCATEEAVYQALQMQFIPPELREGTGEIEAAVAYQIPALVTAKDIQGFIHCHTNYSDGTSTVAEWAEAALAAGYRYVGITDHSAAATYAGGLFMDSIGEQHAEIDNVNRSVSGVRVLKGVEVDILESGALDYDADTRSQFEFVIASVHNRFGQSRSEMTDRILRAMDDPTMAILGHPTGRLLLSREPYPMDLDAIFEKALDRNIAIEINAHPQRLDLDWRHVRRAADMGIVISIGADAHSTAGMSNLDLGIGIARKGWLTAEQILNTRPLEGFLEFVNRRVVN